MNRLIASIRKGSLLDRVTEVVYVVSEKKTMRRVLDRVTAHLAETVYFGITVPTFPERTIKDRINR